jgi:hypothetical protein
LGPDASDLPKRREALDVSFFSFSSKNLTFLLFVYNLYIDNCGDFQQNRKEEDMKTTYKILASTVAMVAFCAGAMDLELQKENIGNSQESSIPEEIRKVLDNPAEVDQRTQINASKMIEKNRIPVDQCRGLALSEQIVLGCNKESVDADERDQSRKASLLCIAVSSIPRRICVGGGNTESS